MLRLALLGGKNGIAMDQVTGIVLLLVSHSCRGPTGFETHGRLETAPGEHRMGAPSLAKLPHPLHVVPRPLHCTATRAQDAAALHTNPDTRGGPRLRHAQRAWQSVCKVVSLSRQAWLLEVCASSVTVSGTLVLSELLWALPHYVPRVSSPLLQLLFEPLSPAPSK